MCASFHSDSSSSEIFPIETARAGTTVSEERDEAVEGGEGAGGGEIGTGKREGVGEEGGSRTRGGRNGVEVSETAYGGSLSTNSTQYTLLTTLPSWRNQRTLVTSTGSLEKRVVE